MSICQGEVLLHGGLHLNQILYSVVFPLSFCLPHVKKTFSFLISYYSLFILTLYISGVLYNTFYSVNHIHGSFARYWC